MGQVYRARDTTLNRDVAIEVLPEAFAQDADRRGRFEREAQAVAALNHPGNEGVSVTAARDSLVTARSDGRAATSVSDGAGGRLLFTNEVGGHQVISSVRPDGGMPQEVVAQAAWPTATSDGRTIVFNSTDPARPGLWKITDGARPAQLTTAFGRWPSVTRDDRSVVFTWLSAGVQSLWMVSIDGGTPTQVTSRLVGGASILSPDGKPVAFSSRDAQNHPVFMICDLLECSSPRLVSMSTRLVKWAPDGRGLTYVRGAPENFSVLPLDGKPARQLTHFTDDRPIADFAWSRDGQRLAIARTTTTIDIVLFKGLKR